MTTKQRHIRSLALLLLAALAVFALGWADGQTIKAEEAEQKLYCDMVKLHHDNPGGSVGWPDYKNTYEEECTP